MQKTDKYSTKRYKKMRYLKTENLRLSNAIKTHLENSDLPIEQVDFLHSLRKSLVKCAALSLYAHSHNEIDYITSLTCDHKVCNVCNWKRQKKIRRKYLRWFEGNETFPVVSRQGEQKVVTNFRLSKFEQKGYEKVSEIKYDLMHLVLTVPHTVNGWKGKTFYFKLIKEKYSFMRKKEEWLRWVIGGEYGVETTRDRHGYHIHIHSLLFVRKFPKNRNRLHLVIFQLWNHLTADDSNRRKAFAKDEIKAMKKGNSMIDDAYIARLNPAGATIIHLSNIYFLNRKGEKVYWNDSWNSENMLKAVMETISYHFKPKMFLESENSYDMDALAELLPEVYRLPLYSKFGNLNGETALTLKDDSLLEDYEETAQAEIADERTYFIGNPIDFYVKDEKIVQKKVAENRVEVLRSHNGRAAVQELANMAFRNNNRHVTNS